MKLPEREFLQLECACCTDFIQILSCVGSRKSPKYSKDGSCILLARVWSSYLGLVYFSHSFIRVSTISFPSLKIRLPIL